MTVKQRLTRSYIYMFLVPLLIAALLLILGVGIALFSLETKYLPRLGLTLWKMHATLEQYETTFSSLEIFIWTYLGAVGMALLLTICFTNFFLTRSLFRHISAPLDELVAGVERIQGGNLDEPIAYDGNDEFKAACDAVDLMAAKLKAALDDEQRRQQSRKELIAGMSHDLKSPLTSIRAYSEAIRDGVAQKPEMQQRYIETICRKEQEIETMVNRLFEFSKLDLSELPLKMEAVDVGAELRAIEEDYSDKAYVNVSADECTAEADREQLRRIAKNIIDNSIKYSGRDRVCVDIRAEKCSDMVRLSFSDDGKGVPDEQLPKLFDLFYRADPAREHSGDGSGLGLAVVKKTAEQMGGSVESRRSVGGGLCIIVMLKEAKE